MAGISGEEEALLARLDRAFASQRAGLTARQREVVRLWQRTDREYEAIQAVARGRANVRSLQGSGLLGRAVEMQETLDQAVRTGRLPLELTVYRGVRSLRRTFGVEDAVSIGSAPRWFRGFTAVSVLRRVAAEDFEDADRSPLERAWTCYIGYGGGTEMSKFITEPGELVLDSELGPPCTPGQLFSRLGVYCESDAVQRAAVAEWLRENEPILIMRMALEVEGYIDAEGRLVPAAAA